MFLRHNCSKARVWTCEVCNFELQGLRAMHKGHEVTPSIIRWRKMRRVLYGHDC